MGHVPPLVTLSGPPAAGTSTLADRLADEFGLEVLNGGDVFRSMADERGVALSEFATLAEDDPDIDRELDDRLEGVIDAHVAARRKPDGNGLLVESRLAGWHSDGRADLSVWLDAPLETRVRRLDDRAETSAELRERERSDAERYREYYGIDISDLSVYDLVVDTGTLSEDGMVRTVTAALEDVRGIDGET